MSRIINIKKYDSERNVMVSETITNLVGGNNTNILLLGISIRDKNGIELTEEDIVLLDSGETKFVIWDGANARYCLADVFPSNKFISFYQPIYMERIGNVNTNPEMIRRQLNTL